MSVFAVASCLLVAASGLEWPMYGANTMRTGYAGSSSLNVTFPPLQGSGDVTPAWSLQAGKAVYAPPVIGNGVVYVGTDSNEFLAIEVRLQWSSITLHLTYTGLIGKEVVVVPCRRSRPW